ncbi:hypothetical protein LQ948_14215 [Jiella sp. MQZ9-1]|uniref:Uncharacterized protein n=1 Tax=Jiella flava TaxID=2816857 RepID=A0A939FZN5_9HYPH|nr:hypothetical protein [Jiella flava]MBO0663789.1 hypothetical protein [Jiella flava]MCD2472362.1 hypothetical protein [Jiella flava]
MIDPSILGALVGLALGVVDFVVIGFVIERMMKEQPTERLGARMALNVARISQLILFPVMGWFVGQTIAS